jgi:hypothetical protein
LGFPLSCRFFIRGEPPNKNAASEAPFQERVIQLQSQALLGLTQQYLPLQVSIRLVGAVAIVIKPPIGYGD